jgi:hypothetical protein
MNYHGPTWVGTLDGIVPTGEDGGILYDDGERPHQETQEEEDDDAE